MRRPLALLLLLFAPLTLPSCAVTNPGVQAQRSMPAARAALRPEYRIFYDTLVDYGQWVLIEPYGYLFRPQTTFHDWQPYDSGFWAPSDSYGWVWISSEPFGWATYHYGRWFRDDYQGWVWQPGIDWGPAWVSWMGNDEYVGWAPLAPGSDDGWMPIERYLFAPVHQLGNTDLQARRGSALKDAVADARPIEATTRVEGVRVPTGPSIERIERLTGRSLMRVKVEGMLRGDREDRPSPAPEGEREHVSPASGRAAERAVLDDTRKAGERAAAEARELRSRGGGVPDKMLVPRLQGVPQHIRERAARDSARSKPGR